MARWEVAWASGTGAWILALLPMAAAVGGCGGPAVAAAQSAPRVAVASSVSGAIIDVAAQFLEERGERVEVVSGASGGLARQILDGAPFELFLAADESFPERLRAAGLTRGPGVVYAVGRLAIFAPTGSPLVPDAHLDHLADLIATGRVGRFAIANPAVAPYGRAAEEVLRRRGLWERLRGTLVLGETIAQAAQFATTGNAVGGLVAYSLVVGPELSTRGMSVLIPASEHTPIRHRMVLLTRSGPTAERFYQYLQEPAARATLQRHGFEGPH